MSLYFCYIGYSNTGTIGADYIFFHIKLIKNYANSVNEINIFGFFC